MCLVRIVTEKNDWFRSGLDFRLCNYTVYNFALLRLKHRTKMQLLLLALAASLVAAQDHDGHDHGSSTKEWEYAGVFDFHLDTTSSLILSVNKVTGNYADKSINVVFLKTSSPDKDGIEAVEATADHLFENASAFANVKFDDNSVIQPGKGYKLELNLAAPLTIFQLGGLTKDTPYVLFSQHGLEEFEGAAGHYMKSKTGVNVEAIAEERPGAAAAKTTPSSAAIPTGPSSENARQGKEEQHFFTSFLLFLFLLLDYIF